MPNPLLPPTVVGPLNEWTDIVTLNNVADGASAQLFADGAPLAEGSQVVVVSLKGLAGKAISATQSKDGVTSPFSQPEIVNQAPTELPPVVFLSNIHTCIDFVLIGGLIPQTGIVVKYNGDVVAEGVARHTTESVRITPLAGKPLKAGDSLTASQSFEPLGGQRIDGPEVKSVPIQNRDEELVPDAPFLSHQPAV